jgi:hypothetical protein
MSPPPTTYTPPSELDSHPEVRRPQAQQPGSPEIPGREPLRASAAPSPAQAPEAADSRWSIQPSKENR